ncbi:MAG: response regulator transcription factor [Clostridia bacterium]|nr:response regulator transcription factor [Clostridia bacterium]
MTELQKENIAFLRSQGESYKAIADALNVSINTVKTFCRRSRLAAALEMENDAETSAINNLISTGNRGNSTGAARYRRKGRTGPILCDVTVSYADADDESAIPDVLNMLSGASFAR